MTTSVARRYAAEGPTDPVSRFAWHQPAAFLVGATLVGFALSRFFLASTGGARRRREVHEVHGFVPGAVPSTGETAVSGGTYGD